LNFMTSPLAALARAIEIVEVLAAARREEPGKPGAY